MKLPAATFIGTGRLGSAMARAFIHAGIPVKSVYNRSEEKARILADELNVPRSGTFPESADDLGEIIFITVSDESISTVSDRLLKLGFDVGDRLVVHCSGNESADILNNIRREGAATASFHPLQSFTKNAGPEDLSDIFFSIQGDEIAADLLEKIAERLGAQSLRINADQKSHLHTAAVFASNYLNALLKASVDTAEESGIPPELVKEALMPLVKSSLENIEYGPFEESLTGPIKRGDVETVKTHLNILKDRPLLLDIYRSLGRQTLEIVKSSASVERKRIEKMEQLFS